MDKQRVDGVGSSRARRRRGFSASGRRFALAHWLTCLLLCVLLLTAVHSARAEDDWDAPREPVKPASPRKPAKDKPAKDKPAKDKPVKAEPAKDEPVKDNSGKEEADKVESEKDAGGKDESGQEPPADPPADPETDPIEQQPDDIESDKDGAGGKDDKAGGDMFLDIASFDDAADDDAGGSDAAGDTTEAEAIPPEVRRPRPQTAEQERTWKLSKTREDPFLNPPGGELGSGLSPAGDIYKPSDWLSHELPLDHSVYLAQDAKGKLQGLMSLSVQTRKGEEGEDLVVLSRSVDYGFPTRTEVLSSLDGLSPRLILREAISQRGPVPVGGAVASAPTQEEGDATESGPLAQPNLRVDYRYDRVTVVWDDGDVASHEHMRALPHSFDVQQLPLIMRLLNYGAKQWPFEAYITLPEEHLSAPLVIKEAKLQNQLSAEGEKVPCYHVEALIGKAKWEWWVQKNSPHRLIRFSDGVMTYTLSEYSQSSRGGY